MSIQLITISDARMLDFPVKSDGEAALSIYQCGTHVPFTVARVFCISGSTPVSRGHHAHRECTQLLVPVAGRVTLIIKDGRAVRSETPVPLAQGLLVRPGLWVEVGLDAGAVLMVLCDQPYNEAEYIRNWNEFLLAKGVQ